MTLIIDRWKQLWHDLCVNLVSQPVYEQIISAYTTPPRAYHNLDHIEVCLTEFEMVKALAAAPIAIELAIWFHDVIYNPQAHDNEERSADFAAEKLARLGVADSLIHEVRHLILATKHNTEVTGDAALLTDIDLAILGKADDEFDRYDTAIRQEYSWVPDDLYRVGRSRVLQGFLDRPSIYQTEFFGNRYEAQARINLQRVVARLQ